MSWLHWLLDPRTWVFFGGLLCLYVVAMATIDWKLANLVVELIYLQVWGMNQPAVWMSFVGLFSLLVTLFSFSKMMRPSSMSDDGPGSTVERLPPDILIGWAEYMRWQKPPVYGWLLFIVPHVWYFSEGVTQYHIAVLDVPRPYPLLVEAMCLLFATLSGPGSFWNLCLPAVGWTVLVIAFWRSGMSELWLRHILKRNNAWRT